MAWQHGDPGLHKDNHNDGGQQRGEVVEGQSEGGRLAGTAPSARGGMKAGSSCDFGRGSSGDIPGAVSPALSKTVLSGESARSFDSRPSGGESALSPKPLLSKVSTHLSEAKELVKTIADKVGKVWSGSLFSHGIVAFLLRMLS